jgi:hypothetical protein
MAATVNCWQMFETDGHSRWRQHGPLKRWYPTTTLCGSHNPEDLDMKHHSRESLSTHHSSLFIVRFQVSATTVHCLQMFKNEEMKYPTLEFILSAKKLQVSEP